MLVKLQEKCRINGIGFVFLRFTDWTSPAEVDVLMKYVSV
jgi:hypothetical protein